ncbi:tetraacyldisaccharide 4'-kinase [Rhizobium sp. L1K21]|uniref:tetraacyldisaccharide 4'-kinase n=1 Tax=Rhizobium sp. L1K21 TaxID=2954933 RepID=UPI0020934ABE|nr:tetraacyldisaccharide 4'-kinase [Rhizobium sp. L1K21]MCO6186962.1 tetraacyldisaccharide 4'-kinase [Rhizobium sp. L1K21]
MVSETPPFWWQKSSWQAWLLSPFSYAYGYFAGRAMARAKRVDVDLPVICVGNFTAGGAGKTPTVIALARAAKAAGLKPGMLSRGYGGSLSGTTIVDPHHHRAKDVGDEPLLLAREGLTVISRNRVDGAERLKREGADIIIMDDGFQSARIAIDYALIVVDGKRGLGNGFMLPAGPVRAPLKRQILYVSGLLTVGEGEITDTFIRKMARAGRATYLANVKTCNAETFKGKKVLAFAGIADPEKFYRTLEETGAEIVIRRSFGDHHHLAHDEMRALLDDAERANLQLVTTAKDHVRLLGHHGTAEDLAKSAQVLEIEMAFDDPAAPLWIINQAIAAFRKRKIARPAAK